jgi:hypothetical protein
MALRVKPGCLSSLWRRPGGISSAAVAALLLVGMREFMAGVETEMTKLGWGSTDLRKVHASHP